MSKLLDFCKKSCEKLHGISRIQNYLKPIWNFHYFLPIILYSYNIAFLKSFVCNKKAVSSYFIVKVQKTWLLDAILDLKTQKSKI